MVKREREDREDDARQVVKNVTGFARGKAHYRYQINLINSVVTPPWTVCLGALGSGIIGVRPAGGGGGGDGGGEAPAAPAAEAEGAGSGSSSSAAAAASSSSSSRAAGGAPESRIVKLEPPDDGDGGGGGHSANGGGANGANGGGGGGGANGANGGGGAAGAARGCFGNEAAEDYQPHELDNGCTPSASSASAAGPLPESKLVKAEPGGDIAEPGGDIVNGEAPAERQSTMPADATIILLINSKDMPAMRRNGKALGEYREDALDPVTGTMRWSSQHRDTNNKMIRAIVGHCRDGGRVLVAARGSPDEEDQKNFKVLGDIGRITDVQESQFLVEEGDTVIQERGSARHHKAISPACLDPGLRSGIGLVPVKFRKSQFRGKWCIHCCYRTANALMHFKELKAEGIAAYIKTERKEDSSDVKKEVEEPQSEKRPAKRLRRKMPRNKIEIKREPAEEENGKTQVEQQLPQAAPEAPAEGNAEADGAADAAVSELGSGGFFLKKEPLEAESQAPLLHGA